jgi:hypothetical protein
MVVENDDGLLPALRRCPRPRTGTAQPLLPRSLLATAVHRLA